MTSVRFGLVLVLVLAVCGALQAADFTLTGTQTKDVTTFYSYGYLYDTSTANVFGGSVAHLLAFDTSTATVSGGSVNYLRAYHTSTANVSGGIVDRFFAFDTSTATVSGGSVDSLSAFDTGTATVFGGSVGGLSAFDTGTATVSGGSVSGLLAFETSTTTFIGENFALGQGLSWGSDGQTILGTGLLSGKWFGSSDVWTTNIVVQDPTATIRAIPEPLTLGILALGMGFIIRRRTRLAL
jgi:hypothetical protein